MAMPIRWPPGRFKYIEESDANFRGWFIFGEDKVKNLVDIADMEGDIFVSFPREVAEKIVEIRRKYIYDLQDAMYPSE